MVELPQATREENAKPEEDKKEEEGELEFPWDETVGKLPRELEELWKRAQSNDKRVDLKKLLEDLPRFSSLPKRPPENNFRQDSRSPGDKYLRQIQQWLLHGLRILAVVMQMEPGDMRTALQQQLWTSLADVYHGISA